MTTALFTYPEHFHTRPELRQLSGQRVTVAGLVPEEHVDLPEVGFMYQIQGADGTTGEAFESELRLWQDVPAPRRSRPCRACYNGRIYYPRVPEGRGYCDHCGKRYD